MRRSLAWGCASHCSLARGRRDAPQPRTGLPCRTTTLHGALTSHRSLPRGCRVTAQPDTGLPCRTTTLHGGSMSCSSFTWGSTSHRSVARGGGSTLHRGGGSMLHKDKRRTGGNVAGSQRVARLLRPGVTPGPPPRSPWVLASAWLKAAPCPHARLSPLAPGPPAPHSFPGHPPAELGWGGGGCGHP